jgi:hypothetical protein
MVLVTLALIGAVQAYRRCHPKVPCRCINSRHYDPEAEDAMIIDCSRRGLMSIPIFPGMVNIKIDRIVLSGNRIHEVLGRQFVGLNVSEIYLDSNPITKVEVDAFQGVEGLKTLVFSGCNMTHIPRVFEYTPDLIDLSLARNHIRNITPGFFKHLTKLHFLDLSRNPLEFHAEMFLGLEATLKDLKLNGVGLTEIPTAALARLRILDNLELQDNGFRGLYNHTFVGLPRNRFTHYIFDNNYIRYIAPDAFNGHPMPIYLDLHENKIKKLDFLRDPCFFGSSIIHLHGNPIHCDCSVYNLTKHRQLKLHGDCMTPRKWRRLPLMEEPEVHTSHDSVHTFTTVASETCGDEDPYKKYDCPCEERHERVHVHDESFESHDPHHGHEMSCATYNIAEPSLERSGPASKLSLSRMTLLVALVVYTQVAMVTGVLS